MRSAGAVPARELERADDGLPRIGARHARIGSLCRSLSRAGRRSPRGLARSPRRLIAPPARAQGEKSNCIDSANNVAYLLNPTDHKVYSYDFSGLQTGGKGYKSSGTPAGSYVYYLNLNKKIATVPAATCDGAESSCGAQGCAAFQTTPDGGECYAVGDAGSVAATFFDPSVNKAGTPQDGVTLVMSSAPGKAVPSLPCRSLPTRGVFAQAVRTTRGGRSSG